MPTKEQIEEYIQCADLELGHECAEAWVGEIRKHLRKWSCGARESLSRISVNDQFLRMVNGLYCDDPHKYGEVREKALDLHAQINRLTSKK
jgi:hypothetical protein